MKFKIIPLVSFLGFLSYFSSAQTFETKTERLHSAHLSFVNGSDFSSPMLTIAKHNARQESTTKQTLDSISNDEFTTYFYYNSSGHLLSILSVIRDSENAIDDQAKTVITYNGTNISEALSSFRNKASGEWKNITKTTYSYGIGGELIELTGYAYETEEPSLVKRFVYAYDASGRLKTQTGLVNKRDYTYDSSRKLSQETDSSCEGGSCVMDSKRVYTYNGEGVCVKQELLKYNVEEKIFLNREKLERSIDGAGNIAEEVLYLWNGTEMKWGPYRKNVYSYNNDYTLSDLVLPLIPKGFEPTYYFHHMRISAESILWDASLGNFDLASAFKSLYHYSPANLTSTIVAEKKGNYNTYPNPVVDNFTIQFGERVDDLSTLELFDAKGQKVFSAKVVDREKISMDGLTKGVYFYQVTSVGRRGTGKLLKE